MDTGYPKIRVRAVSEIEEDVVVRMVGDVFDVEVYPAIRNQPERFQLGYQRILDFILCRRMD